MREVGEDAKAHGIITENIVSVIWGARERKGTKGGEMGFFSIMKGSGNYYSLVAWKSRTAIECAQGTKSKKRRKTFSTRPEGVKVVDQRAVTPHQYHSVGR